MKVLLNLLTKKVAKANYWKGLVHPSQRRAWLDDPVTKSLIASLEARLYLALNCIQMGSLDKESIEATALAVAKHQAVSAEIEDIIDEIKGIAGNGKEKDTETSGTPSSGETGRSGGSDSGWDSYSEESNGQA